MNDLRIRDVMNPSVVVVTADCGFQHIVDVITEYGVSGVPVVGDDDRVVGVISEADLLPSLREHDRPGDGGTRRAANLMTSPAVTVPAGASVAAAAALMLRHRIKRLPVLDDGTGALIGIVTRGDLLRCALRSDAAIQRDVMDELLVHGLWREPLGITAGVHDGVVTLSGTAERHGDARLAAELAGALDGVVAVLDRVCPTAGDERLSDAER